jgi:DNA-directed RNA polymerase specialized sigma24 family protein
MSPQLEDEPDEEESPQQASEELRTALRERNLTRVIQLSWGCYQRQLEVILLARQVPRELCAEAVNEVFTRFLESWSIFQGEDTGPYLRTIALHVASEVHRYRGRMGQQDEEDVLDERSLKQMEDQVLLHQVVTLIQGLEQVDRCVFTACEMQGLTQAEAVETVFRLSRTRLSPDAIRNRRYRIRALVQELIRQRGPHD